MTMSQLPSWLNKKLNTTVIKEPDSQIFKDTQIDTHRKYPNKTNDHVLHDFLAQ